MPPATDYLGADGTRWALEVRTPGASSALLVFRHPTGATSRFDRYAWYQYGGPEARDVAGRLTSAHVLSLLSEADVARLFRVSMPISTTRPLEPGFVTVDPAALAGEGGTTDPTVGTRRVGPAATVPSFRPGTPARPIGLAALFTPPDETGRAR